MNTGEYRCFCPFRPVSTHRFKQQHLLRSRGSYWLRFTRALQIFKKNQHFIMCVCVCVFFPCILASCSLDAPAGVTQEEGRTGFLIHLPSAVRASLFLARRIQPSIFPRRPSSQMLCTNDLIVPHLLGFFFFFSMKKSRLPGFELTSQRVRRSRGYF